MSRGVGVGVGVGVVGMVVVVVVEAIVVMMFEVWVQALLQLEIFVAESAGRDEERP